MKTNNVFHKHLASIDEAFDDERWSPVMQKALRSSSVDPEARMREKERARRDFAREEEKREKAANKFYNKFRSVTRDKEEEDRWNAREERDERRKTASYQKDMDRLKNKLKRAFKGMLIDSAEQQLYDEPDMDVAQAIENATDMDIEGLVQMELSNEDFKRLKEVALWWGGWERGQSWDWRGWLVDEMASEAFKHFEKKSKGRN
jgi:hypothetical protein